MAGPKKVLTRADYHELTDLVAAATTAAREAEATVWDLGRTAEERKRRRAEALATYAAVCTWVGQRTTWDL